MAKETVQAVRMAESKAAHIEKDATVKRDAILLQAEDETKKIVAAKRKEALVKADKELAIAQQKGEELQKAAVQKAEQEILLLKEMVKRKEKVAIDLVLSEVI